MVKLKNIERNGDFIWCDYYPENQPESGFIKVDLSNEKIVERIAAPYEKSNESTIYSHYAMLKLIDIQNIRPLPEITGAAWY